MALFVSHPTPRAEPRQRALRAVALWLAVAAALAATFWAYLNPHLALELANQVWACF
jgi:ferric-dicitrate binding protein FerR (iron transport regulator)